MREIKFRGQRKDTKEWVFGDLLQVPSKGWASIMGQTATAVNIEIIPETIGQFTGRIDMNKREIYEGDIMIWKLQLGVWSDQINKPTQVTIPFMGGNAHLGEVIGNIHDSPELLK